jgi:pimeloyl-ACP methyl ester carboxylesterase
MQQADLVSKAKTIRMLETGWVEAGQRGNPILFFCHGFPDSPLTWRHQIDQFADKYRVIAPFVRGCEASAVAQDLKRYGRDAVVLDHLEILADASQGDEPVICIGHDLGVVHAMALARRLGERLAGLIVINGVDLEMFARRLKDPGQVARSWYMGLMQIPVLPETLATVAPHLSQWLVHRIGGAQDGSVASTDFDRRTVGPLNQYRAFAREKLFDRVNHPRLKVPTLVLWGRDDGALMAPSQSEWDLVAYQATIRILPGGHWLHRDRWQDINLFVSQFLVQTLGQKT